MQQSAAEKQELVNFLYLSNIRDCTESSDQVIIIYISIRANYQDLYNYNPVKIYETK